MKKLHPRLPRSNLKIKKSKEHIAQNLAFGSSFHLWRKVVQCSFGRGVLMIGKGAVATVVIVSRDYFIWVNFDGISYSWSVSIFLGWRVGRLIEMICTCPMKDWGARVCKKDSALPQRSCKSMHSRTHSTTVQKYGKLSEPILVCLVLMLVRWSYFYFPLICWALETAAINWTCTGRTTWHFCHGGQTYVP